MNKRKFIKSAALLPTLLITNQALGAIESKKDKVPNSYLITDNLNILRWRDLVVDDDWTMAFKAASDFARQSGGAKIHIPSGKYYGQLILSQGVYWHGDGKGITVLTQKKGSNKDIVVSESFDDFTSKGPLRMAPINFGITDLTIDGNYLDDFESTILGKDSSCNNHSGYGVKIFGSKYSIDVEIVNCAEIGFYSEAVDYKDYPYEQDCRLSISGRVFGKEGIVFRGPADTNIDHVVLGCAAWLPTRKERDSTLVVSNLYPDEPVHVMVSDETKNEDLYFNGHHEFTFIHLYGNKSGYAYKAMNTGRIKGSHLVCENCRGGAYFGSRVWGDISIVECHNNGRLPTDLNDDINILADVDLSNQQSLNLNLVVRRVLAQAKGYIALRSKGRMANVKLNYFSLFPVPGNAVVALIDSQLSNYDIICRDVINDAIIIHGSNNNINITGGNVKNGSLVIVDSSNNEKTINKINVMADNCDGVISVLTKNVSLDLNINASLGEGQSLFGEKNLFNDKFNHKVIAK